MTDCSRALDRDIDRFGLRSRIERLGAVSQQTLAKLYDRTDLFVLPSRFEGYGMAFADAIAFGVPVIAARSGAIPETVPAQASILVPPDDVPALASVLRRLIENQAERDALRAQARAAARSLADMARIGGNRRARNRNGGMSGFSADWLALREPYDLAARSRARARRASNRHSRIASSLSLVDLACGTGSTLRALTKHLPARQEWRLADNDLGLLLRAGQTSLPGVKVTTVPVDLARDLEVALDGPIEIVTTSALLDLVSPTGWSVLWSRPPPANCRSMRR